MLQPYYVVWTSVLIQIADISYNRVNSFIIVHELLVFLSAAVSRSADAPALQVLALYKRLPTLCVMMARLALNEITHTRSERHPANYSRVSE